ncbi:MAG: hypothetical protein A2201_07780 [Alicyclobacillus sp. RIFOXYA1_FULL_53_8]|nr:MAG: hypothetical protein A2201_07780 [Alicyclobacillus sp. RIFOXYA1_FULL_53_8]
MLALDWPSGPVNIVDDEPARASEWLPVYAHALGVPEPEFESVRMPDAVPVPEGLPANNDWARGASNAKSRNEYGWQPIYPTWRTGFSQTLTPPTQ